MKHDHAAIAAAVLATVLLSTGVSSAQIDQPSAPGQTDAVRVLPGPTETVTKTQRTRDSSGVERDTTDKAVKTQTFSDGNGQLSAHTHVVTSEEKTVKAPPPPPTTTVIRRTTTEESGE
jgi:hypothetical protein